MKKRNGFTLIELLVVIAIIGLLLGILVPVLGKVMTNAKRTAGMANVRNIVMGNTVYADTNKSWFAGLNNKGGFQTNAAGALIPFAGKLYAAKVLSSATAPTLEECNDYALATVLESGEIAPKQLLSPGENDGTITEVTPSSDGTPTTTTANTDGAVTKASNSFAYLHWGTIGSTAAPFGLKGEWKANTNQQAILAADRVMFGNGASKQYSIWTSADSGQFLGAVIRGDVSSDIENGTSANLSGFLTNLKYSGRVSSTHTTNDDKVFSVWGESSSSANFGSTITAGVDSTGKIGSAND